ncbi:hypothetical protein [Microcoleus sp. CAWBG58]|nr:hypothetical protein [Microcoleus sp. CAWBG58]
MVSKRAAIVPSLLTQNWFLSEVRSGGKSQRGTEGERERAPEEN